MKPRLGPAMLTEEDRFAWGYCLLRWSPGVVDLYGLSMDADRRDADLMLYAQQHKLVTWVGPPMIHVRNAVSAYWCDPPWQGTLE